jgi:hypothetical protein
VKEAAFALDGVDTASLGWLLLAGAELVERQPKHPTNMTINAASDADTSRRTWDLDFALTARLLKLTMRAIRPYHGSLGQIN